MKKCAHCGTSRLLAPATRYHLGRIIYMCSRRCDRLWNDNRHKAAQQDEQRLQYLRWLGVVR